jgi:hypothetical protein
LGSGKKTRTFAILREIYGEEIDKIKFENRIISFQNSSKTKSIEITTCSSKYHIELNPSEVGNDDRFIVQEIIKDIASLQTIESKKVDFKSKFIYYLFIIYLLSIYYLFIIYLLSIYYLFII